MRLLWLAAFALCLTAAVCGAVNMRGAWETGAACSIEDATVDDLALLTALFPQTEWTAYAQRAQPLTVANHALPVRTAQVQKLAVLGKIERIARFPLVSGRLPREGETGVCALDAETAFALFRSDTADANRVRVGEDSLVVVGVVDVERPLMMVSAGQDTLFDRLAANSYEELTALVSALGGETDPFELSGAEAARVAFFFCAIPCFGVAAFALTGLRRRGGWRGYLATILLWALLAGIVLSLLRCVPVRLLPTRWSDFSFYVEQLEAFRSRAARLPDARDQMMRTDLVRVGAWSLASCVALWLERKWLKCEK